MYIPPSFLAFHNSIDICKVTIKNIKNMHAVSTNQIADILHFNDNTKYLIPWYIFRRGYSVSKRLVKLTSFKSFPLQLSGYQDISLLSFVRVASSTLIRCGWVFISARSVENCISVERFYTLNTDLQSVLQNIKKIAAG